MQEDNPDFPPQEKKMVWLTTLALVSHWPTSGNNQLSHHRMELTEARLCGAIPTPYWLATGSIHRLDTSSSAASCEWLPDRG